MRPVALLLAALTAAGCTIGPAHHPPKVELQVFAAASLTEAFKALGTVFETGHSESTVTFNFAGTPTLVTQLQQGAGADVLAAADESNMQKALDAGLLVGPPVVITRNRLEIAVAPGNPKHITALADLARPDILYITAASTVPAGRYAAQALSAAGVKASPRSLETDVRSVLSKVQLGEADAGIVYVTDVKVAGSKVAGVEIPDAQNILAKYPAAVVRTAHNPALARSFIDLAVSGRGQSILRSFGFQSP